MNFVDIIHRVSQPQGIHNPPSWHQSTARASKKVGYVAGQQEFSGATSKNEQLQNFTEHDLNLVGTNLFGHPFVVEEGLVDDGVVPVEADAAQVEDGGRAEGDVHGVVHLQGMKE